MRMEIGDSGYSNSGIALGSFDSMRLAHGKVRKFRRLGVHSEERVGVHLLGNVLIRT
jgi:hypothetical protein